MRLLEFVSLIRPLRGDGALARDVSGVAWECRRVAPGNLFVAIPGPGRDTQTAVDIALERGAAAVLCEGREVVSLRATRIQVADVRAALPRVAELFFSQPDRRLKLIGVAGASDTSAPALLLKSILDAAGLKCGLIGSTGCEIGERQLPPPRKNCESLDYHELLAQMVRAGCKACVIEFGPDAIEQKRFAEIAFDSVIFTNFNEEAGAGRGAALVQFCRSLASGPKPFMGVFNIDDPIAAALCESGACGRQLSFGFRAGAEVRGSNLELAQRSLGMVVGAGSVEIRLRAQLTGRQNAANLLAACAGAVALKIPMALIRFTLQKTAAPMGSLEAIGTAGDIAVYVDGARSVGEVARAIESLREVSKGRILVAIGAAGSDSYETQRRLGQTTARLADYAVITTNNPGRESAAQIAAHVERGFNSGAPKPYHIELDRAQAIHDLIHFARHGDCVLITGKGRERHQEFADTIVPFDDREHALAALELRAASGAVEVKPAVRELGPLAILAPT